MLKFPQQDVLHPGRLKIEIKIGRTMMTFHKKNIQPEQINPTIVGFSAFLLRRLHFLNFTKIWKNFFYKKPFFPLNFNSVLLAEKKPVFLFPLK